MAISLKNTQVEQVLHDLAEATGESLTDAAGRAFRERLDRVREERGKAVARSRSFISALIHEARRARVVDASTLKTLTDELWDE